MDDLMALKTLWKFTPMQPSSKRNPPVFSHALFFYQIKIWGFLSNRDCFIRVKVTCTQEDNTEVFLGDVALAPDPTRGSRSFLWETMLPIYGKNGMKCLVDVRKVFHNDCLASYFMTCWYLDAKETEKEEGANKVSES